jgi:hypothetical protein
VSAHLNILIATNAIITPYVINVKCDYLRQCQCRAPSSSTGAIGALLNP